MLLAIFDGYETVKGELTDINDLSWCYCVASRAGIKRNAVVRSGLYI